MDFVRAVRRDVLPKARNLAVPVVYLGELTIAVIGAEGGADSGRGSGGAGHAVVRLLPTTRNWCPRHAAEFRLDPDEFVPVGRSFTARDRADLDEVRPPKSSTSGSWAAAI